MFLSSKRTKCFTMFNEMSPSSLFKFLFLTFPISRTTFVQNVLQMELVQHHSYFGVYTLSLVFPSLWCNNVHVTLLIQHCMEDKEKTNFCPFPHHPFYSDRSKKGLMERELRQSWYQTSFMQLDYPHYATGRTGSY